MSVPKSSEVAAVLQHPVRLRIIQQLGGRELTTTQLRQALPEVAQATLYRHVAALIDADLVVVTDERRVRGAVERTLAIGDRMATVDRTELRAMSAAQLRTSFLNFLAEVAAEFDRTVGSDDQRSRDLLGFTRVPLYVNESDLETIQTQLADLLQPYLSEAEAGEGKSRVNLTTVLLPDLSDPSA